MYFWVSYNMRKKSKINENYQLRNANNSSDDPPYFDMICFDTFKNNSALAAFESTCNIVKLWNMRCFGWN